MHAESLLLNALTSLVLPFLTLAAPTLYQNPLAQDSPATPPNHLSPNLDTKFIRFPTIRESALQARRVLRAERYGTLSTVFPPSSRSSQSSNGDFRESSVNTLFGDTPTTKDESHITTNSDDIHKGDYTRPIDPHFDTSTLPYPDAASFFPTGEEPRLPLSERASPLKNFRENNPFYSKYKPSPPSSKPSNVERVKTLGNFRPNPKALADTPIGLPEYVADCEDDGNPTILAISIATSFRNAKAGSNVSLSIADTEYLYSGQASETKLKQGFFGAAGDREGALFSTEREALSSAHRHADGRKRNQDIDRSGPAAHPRFSLIGYIEPIPEEELKATKKRTGECVEKCFLRKHPDAKAWLPGNEVHESWWARLVVREVYWIGGFGDRAYIGWIPIDEWRKAI